MLFVFPNLPVNSIPPAPEGKRSLRPAKPASGQRRRGPPAGEPDRAGGGRGSDRGEKWRGMGGWRGKRRRGRGSAAGYQNALHRSVTHGTSPSCRCLGARMFFQITNKKKKEISWQRVSLPSAEVIHTAGGGGGRARKHLRLWGSIRSIKTSFLRTQIFTFFFLFNFTSSLERGWWCARDLLHIPTGATYPENMRASLPCCKELILKK